MGKELRSGGVLAFLEIYQAYEKGFLSFRKYNNLASDTLEALVIT